MSAFTCWLGAVDAVQAAGLLCASPTRGPVNQIVHDYVSHLRRRRLAPTTINRRLVAPALWLGISRTTCGRAQAIGGQMSAICPS